MKENKSYKENRFIVMRGIPGSGKSTTAIKLKEKYEKDSLLVEILSTDNQFIIDGVYKFEPTRLSAAHAATLSLAIQAFREGIDVVILDNTNLVRSNYDIYIKYAEIHGYKCFQCVCTGNFKNTHGVSKEKVESYRSRFQNDKLLEHLGYNGN